MRLRGWLVALLLSVAAVSAWCNMLRPGFLGGPTSHIMISGRSMEPTFHTGNRVITHRPED